MARRRARSSTESGGGSSTGFRATLEDKNEDIGGAYYEVDSHAVDTLGIKLIAGRNFRPEEQKYLPERTLDFPRAIILSGALAKTFFPAAAGSQGARYIRYGRFGNIRAKIIAQVRCALLDFAHSLARII